MKRDRKIKLHDNILRFLTLVCFFHFTGLNNGMAVLSVSAARAGNESFAPVVIRKVATALYPGNWKRLAKEKVWNALFVRSGKIVHVASRNIIQNLLVEASYFQICLNQSAGKLLPNHSSSSKFSASVKKGYEIRPALGGGGVCPAVKSSFVLTGSLQNWENQSLEKALSLSSVSDADKYLAHKCENQWLKMKQVDCSADKDRRFFSASKFLMQGRWKNKDQLAPLNIEKFAKGCSRFAQERTVQRLFYFSESGSDDSDGSLLTVKAQQII